MREVFAMWKYTKMLVLTSLTAALYVAVMVPFKGLQIIPGFAEIRPGAVVPIVFGILFGPAGAWGSAIGNLIADFFGTFGPFSVFGFIGNFFYGLTAYKAWESLSFLMKADPYTFSRQGLLLAIPVSILSAAVCASFIGLPLDIFHLFPFAFLGLTIFINNTIVGVILAPLILGLLAPRIKSWNLVWTDIMREPDRPAGKVPPLGGVLIWLGGLGALSSGVLLSVFKNNIGWLQNIAPGQWSSGLGVAIFVGGFLAVYLIGIFLK